MLHFPFVLAFALVTASVIPAEDPKPAQSTAAELKKKIADLEILITKREADAAKVRDMEKAIEAEDKKLRGAGQAQLKEMAASAEKALAAPKERVIAAKQTAEKAKKSVETLAAARTEANEKLKVATDPKEIEALTKKSNELEAALKKKIEEFKTVDAVAKNTAEDYARRLVDARAELDTTARALDDKLRLLTVEQVKLRKVIEQLLDEREQAQRDIRKFKEKLNEIEK